MMKSLCENCLDLTEVRRIEIGPDKGPQIDPYREALNLCETCGGMLTDHDLFGFHQRYKTEREHKVTTEDAGPGSR